MIRVVPYACLKSTLRYRTGYRVQDDDSQLLLYNGSAISLFLFSGAWNRFYGLVLAHIISASAIALSLVILFRALIHKRQSAPKPADLSGNGIVFVDSSRILLQPLPYFPE